MQSDAILITGATGFVGSHLYERLDEAGAEVRGLTRDPESARERWPQRDWRRGDLADRASVAAALEGCRCAYFLAHGMADGDDFRRQELAAAETFLTAAEAAGVERIVYLGGIEPEGEPSEHLASRLEVGEVLRGGRAGALELRASMVIGAGSASWRIVRDLATRLPAMALPHWAASRTQPVALEDVLVALDRARDPAIEGGRWRNIAGPEALSVREMLERTAQIVNGKAPVVIEFPDLVPELSAKGLGLLTDADNDVVEELALGMTQDVLAEGKSFWEEIGHRDLIGFDEAARRALAAEESAETSADGPAAAAKAG